MPWQLVRRQASRLFSLTQPSSSPRSWQRQRLAVATERFFFLRLSAWQRKRELQRPRPQNKNSEPREPHREPYPRVVPRAMPAIHTSYTNFPARHVKTRPRLARKHNIASEVSPMLQDAFFFPPRSICEASARQHQARCSAQTGRCKLVCASCSTQVALRKLLCASCSAQVAPASWSLQVAPCKLLCANCAPCKLLCVSCSASCSRQGALRKLVGASWSAQVALCNLLCASCSAQVAFGPGRNRTRDPPVPGAGARQLPRTSSNNKRGSRGNFRNRKKPWVFAPRPRRFPQRVARAPQKSQKTSSFCTSTTPIPAEGRAGSLEIAKNHGFCTSTTPIPAEGRASMLEIAKNLEFLHLDHADPRRGSIFV